MKQNQKKESFNTKNNPGAQKSSPSSQPTAPNANRSRDQQRAPSFNDTASSTAKRRSADLDADDSVSQ